MNMMALRYGDDMIVIDAGLMFPDVELLGVDLVIPDISFLLENRQQVRALILTHCHEDHVGATPFLLAEMNMPVYGTAFTLAMLERRLEEHGLLEQVDRHQVRSGESVEIGPFQIQFIHVTHSTIACVMLAIRTPLGVVVHSGDFKVDPTPTDNELFDLHSVAECGKQGVLALFSDSTNVERSGFTPSERAVRGGLEEIFADATGRILISCFSSSVHRLQLVVDLASQYDRKLALFGRSMMNTSEIAHRMGYLKIPDGLLLRPADLSQTSRNRVAALIAGSQGEPMSALSRAAVNNHRHAVVEAGDSVVLSARVIPGNEKAIFRMMDHLFRRGAHVVSDDGSSRPVHVSGHASQEELKLMLNLTRPRFFVPIHGAYHHLVAHAALARSMGLPESRVFIMEDGDVLELSSEEGRIVDNVPAGHVFVDGRNLITTASPILRERRSLSRQGVVFVVLARDKSTGEMARPPEVLSQGVLDLEESPHVLGKVSEAVARSFDESLVSGANWESAATLIKDAAGKAFHRETGRSPVIMPLTIEV
jgi:ribonuclease J